MVYRTCNMYREVEKPLPLGLQSCFLLLEETHSPTAWLTAFSSCFLIQWLMTYGTRCFRHYNSFPQISQYYFRLEVSTKSFLTNSSAFFFHFENSRACSHMHTHTHTPNLRKQSVNLQRVLRRLAAVLSATFASYPQKFLR